MKTSLMQEHFDIRKLPLSTGLVTQTTKVQMGLGLCCGSVSTNTRYLQNINISLKCFDDNHLNSVIEEHIHY